jgi:hypothetical protein
MAQRPKNATQDKNAARQHYLGAIVKSGELRFKEFSTNQDHTMLSSPAARPLGHCLLVLVVTFCFSQSTAAPPTRPAPFPPFPKPTELIITPVAPSFETQVVQRTLSGLLVREALTSGDSQQYLWVNSPGSTLNRWRDRWLERTGVPTRQHKGDIWQLVKRYADQGLINGYVVYEKDKSNKPRNSTRPENLSVNLATSLCAPLSAIAVEESQQKRAKALGLSELADCRGRNYAWLWNQVGDQLSRKYINLTDPRITSSRALAVALSAPVVLNIDNQGGYADALDRSQPGGYVWGWGLTPEDRFVEPASKHGLAVTPASLLSNLPILASAAPKTLARADQPKSTTLKLDQDTHYVAFLLSDGDNLSWNLGNQLTSQNFWNHPDRGTLPFGWGWSMTAMPEASPDAWRYLVSQAKPNDALFNQSIGGYTYIDQWPRGAARMYATWMGEQLKKLGIRITTTFAKDWDAPASKRAYRALAQEAQDLRGVFALQYHPYADGKGTINWYGNARHRLPVLAALTSIWDHPPNAHFGPPRHAAKLVNQWASQPVRRPEDRFTWVAIHAWSEFDGVGGYGAALKCAAQLNPDVKVVNPHQLIELLHEARSN